MDVISKYLSNSHAISPVTITWTRFVGPGAASILLRRLAVRVFRAQRQKHNLLNFVRGMLIGAAVSVSSSPSNTCRWPRRSRSFSLSR
ncbi:MAG: hypothetical protein M9908_06585 [Phyllobacteriaceae bacterium]|nr:hypothetical protein [Phyllobacteriaceae bacterium]